MTPLYTALVAEAARQTARFHMPGHKGQPLPAPDGSPLWGDLTALDFTELDGTGNLYTETDGPIRQAERLMASAYGAAHCLFLTGGATQGVLSALAACAKPGDTVLIDRAAHRSVQAGMALLDLRPVYLSRELIQPFDIPAPMSYDTVSAALNAHTDARLVFLTDPTYYGVLTPEVPQIQQLCRECGIPLILDCAHGSHLRFLDTNESQRIVDIVVMSAHKTLPALGQAAFLLVAGVSPAPGDTVHTNLPLHTQPIGVPVDPEHLRRQTRLFGTSSPSYPIMASLDLARAWMEGEGGDRLRESATFGDRLRQKFSHLLSHNPLDPCRITLYTGEGRRDAHWLEERHGVVPEMADRNNIVFILSASDNPETLARLEHGIDALMSRRLVPFPPVTLTKPPELPEQNLTPRQAWFANTRRVSPSEALGQIAGESIAPYPPGVPLVTPGERIESLPPGWTAEVLIISD